MTTTNLTPTIITDFDEVENGVEKFCKGLGFSYTHFNETNMDSSTLGMTVSALEFFELLNGCILAGEARKEFMYKAQDIFLLDVATKTEDPVVLASLYGRVGNRAKHCVVSNAHCPGSIKKRFTQDGHEVDGCCW